MRTLSIIIYCLLTVAASFLFLLQGSRRPRFIRFYRKMAEKEWARKGFILILAASAIAWNFACFVSYGNSPWLLPGLALSLSLLSYRLTHAVLWRLAGIRRILLTAYCAFLLLVVLHVSLGFPPELISLYMTVALIIEAGCLYPSRDVMWAFEDWQAGTRAEPGDGEIYKLYFQNEE